MNGEKPDVMKEEERWQKKSGDRRASPAKRQSSAADDLMIFEVL
jgi:hypothetical protein